MDRLWLVGDEASLRAIRSPNLRRRANDPQSNYTRRKEKEKKTRREAEKEKRIGAEAKAKEE